MMHHYGIVRGFVAEPFSDPLPSKSVWRTYCIECSEEQGEWVQTCPEAYPGDVPEALYDPPEDS